MLFRCSITELQLRMGFVLAVIHIASLQLRVGLMLAAILHFSEGWGSCLLQYTLLQLKVGLVDTLTRHIVQLGMKVS